MKRKNADHGVVETIGDRKLPNKNRNMHKKYSEDHVQNSE